MLDESCELRGQTWGELTASRRTSETWVSTSDGSRSPSSSSCRTALAVCRHRAPCQPSSVIGTSVSLRRIDRACYQDRCDAHSDTSDDTYSPTRRDAKRSRREPEEGVHTASRSVDHVARSMPASAWRTPWTVAKPKTPMVAVRWRERRRSRPHHSRRRPNLTRNPTRANNPTQPKKHDSEVGPSHRRRRRRPCSITWRPFFQDTRGSPK